jgi:hypothetical protein
MRNMGSGHCAPRWMFNLVLIHKSIIATAHASEMDSLSVGTAKQANEFRSCENVAGSLQFLTEHSLHQRIKLSKKAF